MKRPGIVPLRLLLVLLTLLLSGCTFLDKLKARDHLNKGVNAYEVKKYDQAVEHFQKSVELDPELTTAMLYLATAYRAQFLPGAQSAENLEMARLAITTFERVIKQDPTNANAMANIAGIYQGLNDYDQAKDWYRKRVEVEQTNAEPLYGIAVIDWQLAYDKTGMTGDNVQYLGEQEKAEVHALVDEGIDALKKALELKPDYVEAMMYLNLLYREKAKLVLKDEEEKKRWQREADRLALQALETKRQQELEAERLRRSLTGSGQAQ